MQQPVIQASYLAGPRFDEVEIDVVEEEQEERKRTAGSFTGRLVSDEMAARIGVLESRLRNWFPDRPKHVEHWAISSRAFAELVLTLVLLKPNQDGTNPSDSHRDFVQLLHQKGVFQYAFNHSRYKAVRDYLSSKGYIEWKSNKYRVGREKGNGRKDGTACKWKVDEQLVERVLAVVRPKAEEEQALPPHVGFHLTRGPHVHMVPERVLGFYMYPKWYKGGPLRPYLDHFQLAA